MEIDNTVAVSLFSRKLKEKLILFVPLTWSLLLLCTYIYESIPVLGKMNVEVKHGTYMGQHTLQVVEGSGLPLHVEIGSKASASTGPACICALSTHVTPAPAIYLSSTTAAPCEVCMLVPAKPKHPKTGYTSQPT